MQLKSKHIARTHRGITLIEVLMSLAVFAVLMTAAAASILGSIDSNQKAQSINSVMTNLTIALESMGRDIRVGSKYSMDGGNTPESNVLGSEVFYYTDDRGVPKRLFLDDGIIKLEYMDGSGDAPLPLTATEVDIQELDFSLFVRDASGKRQPEVKISLIGEVKVQERTATNFYLQTVVSQRTLNIEL